MRLWMPNPAISNYSFFKFQIYDDVIRSRDTNNSPLHPVDNFLHPPAGVHDLQRVALPSTCLGPGSGLLLLWLAEEQRCGRQRTLSVIK